MQLFNKQQLLAITLNSIHSVPDCQRLFLQKRNQKAINVCTKIMSCVIAEITNLQAL